MSSIKNGVSSLRFLCHSFIFILPDSVSICISNPVRLIFLFDDVFSSIFKNYTGETFIEALTKKRMEKAKVLLEHGNLKTYEIAAAVGYSDAHYFSITFKKIVGKTPTEYAKEVRN